MKLKIKWKNAPNEDGVYGYVGSRKPFKRTRALQHPDCRNCPVAEKSYIVVMSADDSYSFYFPNTLENSKKAANDMLDY